MPSDSKPRIVMISSLERSGSTIFDLYLGEQLGLASFGEVERTIMPHSPDGLADLKDRPCTCGAVARECPFWRHVIEGIERAGKPDLTTRYKIFIQTVATLYGPETVAVDSSKTIRAMKAANRAIGNDLRIIHLTRDVRGWVNSIKAAERRKKEISLSRLFQRGAKQFVVSYMRHNVLRRLPSFYYVEWALRNFRLRHAASRIDPSLVLVSYDGLVLYPASSAEMLKNALSFDVGFNRQVTDKHVVRGNRTAFETKNILPLSYDWTWASMPPSLMASALGIYRLNRSWVWGFKG